MLVESSNSKIKDRPLLVAQCLSPYRQSADVESESVTRAEARGGPQGTNLRGLRKPFGVCGRSEKIQ